MAEPRDRLDSPGAQMAPELAGRVGRLGRRAAHAWRVLPSERRLAAGAAVGLFLALFLPWYQETVLVPGGRAPAAVSASLTGWASFSFVEAAVLLVAGGVLLLLFQRAEGRAFHLPGGDGGVISAAGAWSCALVVWRIFDKQSATIRGPGAEISGVQWGIFVALALAALLTYAGQRIRAAHRPEPPLPGEAPAAPRPGWASADATTVAQPPPVPAQPHAGPAAPHPLADPLAGRAQGWLSAPRRDPGPRR